MYFIESFGERKWIVLITKLMKINFERHRFHTVERTPTRVQIVSTPHFPHPFRTTRDLRELLFLVLPAQVPRCGWHYYYLQRETSSRTQDRQCCGRQEGTGTRQLVRVSLNSPLHHTAPTL